MQRRGITSAWERRFSVPFRGPCLLIGQRTRWLLTPSLLLSGLHWVCRAVGGLQGTKASRYRSEQLVCPPFISGDAQLPSGMCAESLSGVGPAQGEPAQAFSSSPSLAWVKSSCRPSPAAAAAGACWLTLPCLPRNNLPLRHAGGAGDGFTVVASSVRYSCEMLGLSPTRLTGYPVRSAG